MPHFEIKVGELERACIANAKGFRVALPKRLTSADFDKLPLHADPCKIVDESEECKKAWQEYQRVSEENRDAVSAIYRKYPETDRKSDPFGREFLSQFSEQDLLEVAGLREETKRVLAAYSKIADKENFRVWRLARKLYGITGIVQGRGETHKFYYKHFVIPRENHAAAADAVKAGYFVKEYDVEDLILLEFLLERTKDIKNGKVHGHNPRFSIPQIMRELPGESRPAVRQRLESLTGILCHTYGPEGKPYNIRGGPKYVYNEGWFFPHRRIILAEKALKRG